jgi:hypothetical protein
MTRFYNICLLAFLFFPFHSMASHGTGGEISWECQGNGQYIFRLNFYRDCAGIAAPNSVSLTTTVPGVTFISLQKIAQFSITNNGYLSDGVQTCAQCASAVPGSLGLHEKVIYESLPVTLPGLPADVVGWQFYWGECCRSNFTNNISNPGSVGFRYRAVMYRTAGHQPGQCFDSSPVFAEIPQYNFCTGYAQSFSCMAIDPEGDSLTYAWAQPYDDNGANAPWSPGYSLNSQLPSTTQNPLNEPAVLNSFSGQVDLKSFTGGLFAVCTKATSYRDGYKSAEIFRELSIVLNNSCAPILGGAQNLPPVINAPFIDPVTGLNTSWDTTVFAGDTVDFTISHQDFQFFNNTQGQVMTVTARGDQFGSNFTDPLSGCLDSPCATVFPSLPTTVPIAGQFTFNWVTSAAHAATLDNTHYFTFSICDNYCPANACVTKTAAIRVVTHLPLAPPVIRCASVNQNGDVNLNWSPTTSIDTFGYFNHYKIYARINPGGQYTIIDSVPGINSSAYTVTASQINAAFGTSALYQKVYFMMTSVSSQLGGGQSVQSASHSTMVAVALNTSQSQVELYWTSSGNVPSASNYYRIYREYPIGNWILLDSTFNITYIDISSSAICNDSVSYRIEKSDTTGCLNVSTVAGIRLNTPSAIAGIGIGQALLCSGGTAWLSSATTPATYLWSTGATTQSIQVNTLGNYTVTVTNSSGCSGTGTIQVTSGGNPPTPVITSPAFTFCQGSSTTLNAGGGYVNYNWSTGAASQTIVVNTPGIYTVTVTNANGCTGSASVNVTVNPNPNPVITGNTVICQGQTTTLTAQGGYTNYQWSTGQAFNQITVITGNTYTITVTDANGCTGSASVNVTVNPLPGIGITAVGSTSFCQGDSVRLEAMGVGAAYLWHRNNSPVTPFNATMVHYAKTKGSYYCVISDFNGCTNSSNIIYVDVPCVPIDPSQQRDPVTGESDQASIEVYPNPSFDEFTVKVSSSLYHQPDFIISDLSGRAIEFSWKKVDESTWVINIPHPGFYFLKHQNQIIRLLKLE